MDVLLLILGAFAVITTVFSYIYGLFLGGTRSSLAGSSTEQARIIEDLGPLCRTFTNYTPWRFRFGAVLLVIGIVCGAIGHIQYDDGFKAVAWIALIFGAPTMLYVAFMRIDRLELHARGLILRAGKSKATAVYYSDIKNSYYRAVVYSTLAADQRPVAKALVLELHDGGSIQIGKNFMQFAQIADAIREAASACTVYQNRAGNGPT